MRKPFSRALSLFFVTIWLLSFVSCAQKEATSQKGPSGAVSSSPAGEEAVTLDWYIHFSWFTTPWGGNLVSDTITQKTGTNIQFNIPTSNEREKLNAMIDSGNLPDLLTMGHWEPQVLQLIQSGLVYPLNELADQYDPTFWEAADPQRVAWYTQPDGNFYAYPNSSYTPQDYAEHDNIGSNQAFLVRQDIYEAIGSPDMTTPEGFMQAVRDAAAKFPEADGGPLLPIGLYDFDRDGCFSLEGILMNLLAIPFEEDGRKYDRFTHPDYIAWLKVFRQLYQEGYLTDETLVGRRSQTAERVAQGRFFCMLYQYTDIADQQKLLYDKDPGGAYMAVDGPKNSNGDPHTLPGVGINGWTVTLISKSCKDPERAIQMMSYMMSEEGQKLLYCGVEGETYDMVEGKPAIKPEVLDLLNSDRTAYNQKYGAANTYWMLQDEAMQLDWEPPLSGPLAQPEAWTYPYTVYSAEYDSNFAGGTPPAEAYQKIREEWGRTLPKLLMAESDEEFDTLFAAYLAKRDTLGFAVVQEEATQQMLEAKKKLDLVP